MRTDAHSHTAPNAFAAEVLRAFRFSQTWKEDDRIKVRVGELSFKFATIVIDVPRGATGQIDPELLADVIDLRTAIMIAINRAKKYKPRKRGKGRRR